MSAMTPAPAASVTPSLSAHDSEINICTPSVSSFLRIRHNGELYAEILTAESRRAITFGFALTLRRDKRNFLRNDEFMSLFRSEIMIPVVPGDSWDFGFAADVYTAGFLVRVLTGIFEAVRYNVPSSSSGTTEKF